MIKPPWYVRLASAIANPLHEFASNWITNEFKRRDEEAEKRIRQAKEGTRFFQPDELVYAARSLCDCGHGMAYPKFTGINGEWNCSAVLRGIADRGEHQTGLPFMFYEIKSENDNSEGGHTTRGATVHPKPGRVIPPDA